ncbi:unnamed protein product [Ranitomeya imitator]|uniref:Tetraspanin n=1 Tax=Ranitomeya imitator TaxID=111125 RepID=A0ABN9KP71_9NEOB|nr:unnamed protein product [Ranitomeya imitator]
MRSSVGVPGNGEELPGHECWRSFPGEPPYWIPPCGAITLNAGSFAVCWVLIFLVEIAAAIAGYVYRGQLQSAFSDTITDGLKNYNKTKEAKKGIDDLQQGQTLLGRKNEFWIQHPKQRTALNSSDVSCTVRVVPSRHTDSIRVAVHVYTDALTLMGPCDACAPTNTDMSQCFPNGHTFKCCGANNFTDWKNYDPFKGTNDVPDSCCKQFLLNCGKNLTNIYTAGCVPTIEAIFKTNIGIIAGVALGIAFFEVLGIIFACCLMKGIRSGYEVM